MCRVCREVRGKVGTSRSTLFQEEDASLHYFTKIAVKKGSHVTC